MNLINWSTEQKAIFNWGIMGTGNLCVEAYAGAAKTSTIVEMLNRVNASSILYAVFNKKNQLEAEKKISNKNVLVKTLHGVGYGFIMRNWRGVRASGYAEFGRVKDLYPDAPEQVHFQAARLVSYLKNLYVSPTKKEAMDIAILRDIDVSQRNSDSGWSLDKVCDMALDSMEKSKVYPKNRLISFDDMVWLPHVHGWIKPSFKLVIIDEAQDMNTLQLRMAIGCCLPDGRICIVGDSCQCIYNFRGAMQDGLERYSIELNAKKLTLSTTYRCPHAVVRLAQTLVKGIQAKPDAEEGEVVSQGYDSMINSIKPLDSILCRKNWPLMTACLALLRKKVPAYIEGKDIAKKLIQLVDGLEAVDMADFYSKIDAWLAIRQAKTTIYNAGRMIEEATDTNKTLKVLAETCLTVEDLKNKINSLFMDAENVRVPSVVCSTVHKAKGLEWNNVHLLMEHFGTTRVLTPEQTQEEQNIKYVAYTRAKQRLIQVSSI